MEEVDSGLVLGLALLVGVIVFLLWFQHATERAGTDDLGGRLTRLLIILMAIGSIYFLLVRR